MWIYRFRCLHFVSAPQQISKFLVPLNQTVIAQIKFMILPSIISSSLTALRAQKRSSVKMI